jgi:hypothetical protein
MSSSTDVTVRYIGVYLCGIIVVSGIARLVVILVPKLSLPVFVVWLMLLSIWTYGGIVNIIREFRGEKEMDQGNQRH